MKTPTNQGSAGLRLSLLAALSMAACSGQPSPTAVTAVSSPPSTSMMVPTATSDNALTIPAPHPMTDDFGGVPVDLYTCSDFREVRLRAVARGPNTVVQYAVDGVPRTAFYWIRFWPAGRHIDTPVDAKVGVVAAGEGTFGEFVALRQGARRVAGAADYHVDLEMTRSREDYERGVRNLGQCGRGGSLRDQAPPPSS